MNVVNVLEILTDQIQKYIDMNEITQEDQKQCETEFAVAMSEIIIEGCEKGDTLSDTLVLSDFLMLDADDAKISSLPRSRQTADCDNEYDPASDQPTPGRSSDRKITDDQKKAVLDFAWSDDGRRRKITSIRNRHRFVKDWKQIEYWQKQMRTGGDRESLLKLINEGTFEDFLRTREKGIDIHDEDIQIWAADRAAQHDFNRSFTASHNWVQKFKKDHQITSRRITAFVTRANFEDKLKLQEEAREWATRMRNLINTKNISPAFVFNADQSGFNYEMTRKRSLALVGEDTVEKVVDSKNATTHSFTILPLVSMNGEVYKKMLVTFQETNGSFGPIVWENMIKPPNLIFDATTSGIMTKNGCERFVKELLAEAVSKEEHNLILLDHWGPFTNKDKIAEWLPENVSHEVQNIPRNCTPFCQPWDVFGFGPWKDFEKKLEHYLKLKHEDYRIPTRNHRIVCMSIMHNQMSSPRFIGMYQYAFVKAGLRTREHGYSEFESPSKFIFQIGVENCNVCNDIARIRCAWCKNHFCLHHFMIENPEEFGYHFCSNYVN